MCGIAGFIGYSKDSEATYELATNLFEQIESRGTDAAGFWGTQKRDGKILYHKEPVKASEFIKGDMWDRISHMDPDLFLMHARGASTGVGAPAVNKNNHPFVSSCHSIGLIHNGRIPDAEYKALKRKYQVDTGCDSEILLRIFEQGIHNAEKLDDLPSEDKDVAVRLNGIRGIWSQIVRGHMAVGIGERLDKGERRLWLFRNMYRPIWLADLRANLGQVWFFSTPEIWQDAVYSCSSKFYKHIQKVKLIELPTEQIWVLTITPEKNVVGDGMIMKFDVCPEGMSSFEYDGEPLAIPRKSIVSEVITKLDEDGDVVTKKSYTTYTKTETKPEVKTEKKAENTLKLAESSFESENIMELDEYSTSISIQNVVMECQRINQLVGRIETTCENAMMEQSMSASNYADVMSSLEQTAIDLQGTLKLIEGR